MLILNKVGSQAGFFITHWQSGTRLLSVLLAAFASWAAAASAHPPLKASLAELERRLASTPDDAVALRTRGELRRLLGDWPGAESDLAAALALDPEVVDVQLYRARLYREMGRPTDAVAAATSFLETSAPGHPLRAAACVVRARARRDLGLFAAALADLERALAATRRPTPELFLERFDLLQARLAEDESTVSSAGVADQLLVALDDGIQALGPTPSLQLRAIELELQRREFDRALKRLDSIRVQAERQDVWLARRDEILLAAGRSSQANGALTGLASPERLLRSRPQGAPTGEALAAGRVRTVSAVNLTRGPYLQLARDDSIVVRWRTDVASSSRVAWGTAPGSLDSEIVDLTEVTEHEVTVPGLTPASCFVYSVGTASEVLAGDDTDHWICTAPAPESAVRVWVLGDSGTADANAAAVRDAYLGHFTDPRPDVWLMLGDNAYPNGTDDEYQAALFDMYPTILSQAALWPTIGNHDAHSSNSGSQTGPYFDMFSLPAAAEAGGLISGTEAYYAFDHGPVHFVCLDSAGFSTPTTAMLDWLEADLASTSRPWIVAYFHHPPYSKGSHDSDWLPDSGGRLFAMREIVLPILESHGVDLVLTGHSHSYERSVLLDGHYDTSDMLIAEMVLDGGDGSPTGDGAYVKAPGPRQGAVYAVAGSSGKISGGSLDHPVMHVSLNELGSVVLEIEPQSLEGIFLDAGGRQDDLFRIEKALSEIFLDGFESGDTSAWSRTIP